MKKLVIASDIHGSAHWCAKVLERFHKESEGFAAGEVRLLLLGDVLYHGPRNDLPQGYAPKEVIAMLNPLRDRIFCVRGNCDGEVDQMVLNFPIMADYAVFELFGRTVYATHGHHWNAQTPPPLCAGDVLLYGHFHVPMCEDVPLPGAPSGTTAGGTATGAASGTTGAPTSNASAPTSDPLTPAATPPASSDTLTPSATSPAGNASASTTDGVNGSPAATPSDSSAPLATPPSFTVLNPGSSSLPKNASPHSLMVWDEQGVRWVDLESGDVFQNWHA